MTMIGTRCLTIPASTVVVPSSPNIAFPQDAVPTRDTQDDAERMPPGAAAAAAIAANVVAWKENAAATETRYLLPHLLRLLLPRLPLRLLRLQKTRMIVGIAKKRQQPHVVLMMTLNHQVADTGIDRIANQGVPLVYELLRP